MLISFIVWKKPNYFYIYVISFECVYFYYACYVARTIKNSYGHQRETTETQQLRPFSKWGLLLNERISLLPLRAIPHCMEKHFFYIL